MKLTNPFHQTQKLTKHITIPPLPHTPSWPIDCTFTVHGTILIITFSNRTPQGKGVCVCARDAFYLTTPLIAKII
jgi:hypothetical protein